MLTSSTVNKKRKKHIFLDDFSTRRRYIDSFDSRYISIERRVLRRHKNNNETTKRRALK
jgi:hypothetical protein